MSVPDSKHLVTAADRRALQVAAVQAKDSAVIESEEAAKRRADSEKHFWSCICNWVCETEDSKTLRESSVTFLCEDTTLVGAEWLVKAETALTDKGFTVTRDKRTRKFTITMPDK